MESFGSILTAVGLGVGAGVNAYATFSGASLVATW